MAVVITRKSKKAYPAHFHIIPPDKHLKRRVADRPHLPILLTTPDAKVREKLVRKLPGRYIIDLTVQKVYIGREQRSVPPMSFLNTSVSEWVNILALFPLESIHIMDDVDSVAHILTRAGYGDKIFHPLPYELIREVFTYLSYTEVIGGLANEFAPYGERIMQDVSFWKDRAGDVPFLPFDHEHAHETFLRILTQAGKTIEGSRRCLRMNDALQRAIDADNDILFKYLVSRGAEYTTFPTCCYSSSNAGVNTATVGPRMLLHLRPKFSLNIVPTLIDRPLKKFCQENKCDEFFKQEIIRILPAKVSTYLLDGAALPSMKIFFP